MEGVVIVLIFRHKVSRQEKSFVLKRDSDLEIVREIAMRIGVFLDDFEFDLQAKLL